MHVLGSSCEEAYHAVSPPQLEDRTGTFMRSRSAEEGFSHVQINLTLVVPFKLVHHTAPYAIVVSTQHAALPICLSTGTIKSLEIHNARRPCNLRTQRQEAPGEVLLE